ncbi:hypothetical protein BJ508DRAFT_89129 [Ascobolus immersus RN42]|uniref:Extracellular membrane protein CFEM domain-containing protein n=1 Tax=Ascobolus immersus RN42 TaxID=1160509 RepID=A0A3N4ICU2_ASCIM|nr:hypothetical protein BJ508DRAFT_89129 [Ascobolus immersus RN42]
MVAFKNVVALAAIALSSLVAAQAPPPACVLACVNEASSPSAYKEICETKVSTTWTCLKSSCSDAYDDASKHVQERCKAEGLTVDMKKAVPAKKEEKEDKEEDKKETGSS